MKIGVLGAGLIGGYVGGRLAAPGRAVILVGRESLRSEVAANGLRFTDYRGSNLVAPPEHLRVETDPASLADCDVVLVAVKSGGTAEAGAQLKPHLRPGTVVVSLQNGVRNAQVLRDALGAPVHAGMVPFNVVRPKPGQLHQATSGTLVIEKTGSEQPLVDALVASGLPARAERDIVAVQWGKLLLNLNNSVNAMAGIPLKAELETRGYRRVLAACMGEALGVLRQAGIRPKSGTPLPAPLLPRILSLPDALFRIAAASSIRIDPEARSSMQEDLTAGRKTEVDTLNGEIVALARSHGTTAPLNEAMVRLVHQAEGNGSPRLSPQELQRQLGLA